MQYIKMLWVFLVAFFQVLLFGAPEQKQVQAIKTSLTRELTETDKEFINAAIRKRERKALDVHGMRYHSIGRVS